MTQTKSRAEKFWTHPAVVFFIAFFCCFLWGSASPAIKIGYELFTIGAGDLASRFVFAGVRFFLAGMMVIAFGSVQQRRFLHPSKISWKYVFVLMTSLFLAAFVFRFEKLTAAKVTGSIAGFLGVLLIVTAGASSGGAVSFAGEGCMVIAAFANAVAGCYIKKFSAKENPVTLSGWQFFCGGIVLMLAGLALLYMGFISAGAYTLWGILLKYNDVSRITILGFMNPVLGVLLSALFLGEGKEAFSIRVFCALVLVSIGIILSGKKKR